MTATRDLMLRPLAKDLGAGVHAVSLSEPWASMVALGWKRNETRSWRTRYRGWLAIHAAQSIDRDFTELQVRQGRLPRASLATMAGAPHPPSSPGATWCGHVVAIAQLVRIERVQGFMGQGYPLGEYGPVELELGDYSAGRYVWRLANVWRLEAPAPASGRLGVWTWQPPADLRLARVENQTGF